MGSMVIAGIYLRAVKVSRAEEFEKIREEDREVIEAEAQEAKLMEQFKLDTRWELMPCIVKVALVTGSWCVFGMLFIYNFFSAEALEPFELTDSLSKIDNNPILVFKKPYGLWSLYF